MQWLILFTLIVLLIKYSYLINSFEPSSVIVWVRYNVDVYSIQVFFKQIIEFLEKKIFKPSYHTLFHLTIPFYIDFMTEKFLTKNVPQNIKPQNCIGSEYELQLKLIVLSYH